MSGQNFRTSAKGKAWGGGGLYTEFSSPAADGCHRPFSLITAQTWSRVTVIFLIVVARSPLQGVQFISICCSVKPAVPGHHHSHSAGYSRWIKLTPWCGSNNPCSPVSKHCSLRAAETGRRGGQGSSPGSGEIAASPAPWQSVSMAVLVCSQSEWNRQTPRSWHSPLNISTQLADCF